MRKKMHKYTFLLAIYNYVYFDQSCIKNYLKESMSLPDSLSKVAAFLMKAY